MKTKRPTAHERLKGSFACKDIVSITVHRTDFSQNDKNWRGSAEVFKKDFSMFGTSFISVGLILTAVQRSMNLFFCSNYQC